jgi:hypothetical protein
MEMNRNESNDDMEVRRRTDGEVMAKVNASED